MCVSSVVRCVSVAPLWGRSGAGDEAAPFAPVCENLLYKRLVLAGQARPCAEHVENPVSAKAVTFRWFNHRMITIECSLPDIGGLRAAASAHV